MTSISQKKINDKSVESKLNDPNLLNVVESRVNDLTNVVDTIYETDGRNYFSELTNRYTVFKNNVLEGDIINDGALNILFSKILVPRMNFISLEANKGKWNTTDYLYGLTVRMKKTGTTIDSCNLATDLAIPNNGWDKLVKRYTELTKGNKVPLWISDNKSKIDQMIAQVNCERGICKDNRWKSGMSKMYFCNGQESNPFYQELTATSVGGRKSRKSRKPRKTRRTRRVKRRRTRRSRK